MLIEAFAHHFLEDAWSMGHMWERWGSPDLTDFVDAAAGDGIDQTASMVAIGAGLIHGAKAVTGFDDALCAPSAAIQFRAAGEATAFAGAGDLFLDAVQTEPAFAHQRVRMLSCGVAAVREVYAASAQSFGPAHGVGAGIEEVELKGNSCFGQRATNRAMFVGAGLDVRVSDLTAEQQDELTSASGPR